MLPAVPFSSGITYYAEKIACWSGISILLVMIIAVSAMFAERQRNSGRMALPRDTYSIPAVMSYLYGARMLEEFRAFSGLSTYARNRHIEELGKKYGFGRAASTVDGGIPRLGLTMNRYWWKKLKH